MYAIATNQYIFIINKAVNKFMSLADFKILEKLGSGAYSSVYKVQRVLDSKIYALKKITFVGLTQKQKQNSLNQIRILASIRHENIIGYREAFLDQETRYLCIIMEYADGGDLYQKITEKVSKKSSFDQNQVWQLLIQVTRALKILHQKNILHRDLKSANVFLTKNGIVKLGDMNVSKISERGLCQTQTGTPYYASPEVWKDQPYGSKSDIWSLGCVLYQMVSLHPPFQAEDMQGLYKKITKGIYPKPPLKYSSDLQDIIRLLLQTDPFKRPSCDKILKLKVVMKRLDPQQSNQSFVNPQFLQTIRMPPDIYYLTQNLPKPNYMTPHKAEKIKMETSKTQKKHSRKIDPRKYNILPRVSVEKKGFHGNHSLLIKNASIIEAARSHLENKEQMPINYREKQAQQIRRHNRDKNEYSLPAIKRKQHSIVMNPHQKMELIQKIYRQPYTKKINS